MKNAIIKTIGTVADVTTTVAISAVSMVAGITVGNYMLEEQPLNLDSEIGNLFAATTGTAVTALGTNTILLSAKNKVKGKIIRKRMKKAVADAVETVK